MRGLLYKEIVLNKKSLLFMLAGELLMSCMIIYPQLMSGIPEEAAELIPLMGSVVFMLMFLVMGMMTASVFETDEIKKWAYFIESTPLTHEGHILAKYVFVFLIYLTLLLLCGILSVVSSLRGYSVNFLSAVVMMCVMLLVNAVEFPFIVRLGSKAGGNVRTAVMLAITLIIFEIIFFVDNPFAKGGRGFFAALGALAHIPPMTGSVVLTLVLTALFTALFYVISYKISCDLYMKGAEDYI